MTPWLVIGRGGQLSGALEEMLAGRAVFLGQDVLDLSQPEKVQAVLAQHSPSAVLNAAAYTQVDLAEKEQALATAINADAVHEMAIFCASREIPLMHISTDYVFDGSGQQARREEAPPAPLNVYGQTKLAGEQAIINTGGRYIILRTSWVFDALGKNFVNTMLRLGKEREVLTVVDDQVGAPTYAPHLAQAMIEVLEKAQAMPLFPSGVYHACSAGETSWCGFAREVFTQAVRMGEHFALRDVQPILTAAYPTPAKRPLNSRLDCSKLAQQFGIRLPHWQQGLKECLEKKYAGV